MYIVYILNIQRVGCQVVKGKLAANRLFVAYECKRCIYI